MKTTMPTLIKRELWEHRGAFLITPITIAISILILSIMAMIIMNTAMLEMDGERFILKEQIQHFSLQSDESLQHTWGQIFFGISSVFNSVLFIILIFYLLGSLSDDRKDRSVLFWKSMPVSDTETVLSKLLSALVLAPILVVIAASLTHLGMMLLSMVFIAMGDGSLWQLTLKPAPLFTTFFKTLLTYLVHGVWMLPFYGWLLLASAFARRKPFLMAIAPLFIIMILENFFSMLTDLNIQDNFITPFILGRFKDGVLPVGLEIRDNNDAFSIENYAHQDWLMPLLERFASLDLWLGVALGSVFIIAAIWLRRYRDDS